MTNIWTELTKNYITIKLLYIVTSNNFTRGWTMNWNSENFNKNSGQFMEILSIRT